MLNFAICDDNLEILDRLSKMLESIFIANNLDASLVFSTESPSELLKYLQNNAVNVLLLDIELKSNINGLELAELVRKTNKSVYIIFTTGHLEHILNAFKVKTFDYLPKPITQERLEETVLRLVDDISQAPKKFIRLDNKNTIINEDSINYIKRDGMKLVFYTENRSYEIYSSFNKIKSCLPDNFVRCHKSFIANINNISDVCADNTIVFNDNSSCFIGPKYKDKFMEVFNNGFFTEHLDSSYNRE